MKALITGASGGIGSAVAELLRQNGYEILTLSSRFEDMGALAEECRALAAAQGIDALILCAGTAKFAPLEAMSESEILKILWDFEIYGRNFREILQAKLRQNFENFKIYRILCFAR